MTWPNKRILINEKSHCKGTSFTWRTMSVMAFQITGDSTVCFTAHSGWHHRNINAWHGWTFANRIHHDCLISLKRGWGVESVSLSWRHRYLLNTLPRSSMVNQHWLRQQRDWCQLEVIMPSDEDLVQFRKNQESTCYAQMAARLKQTYFLRELISKIPHVSWCLIYVTST